MQPLMYVSLDKLVINEAREGVGGGKGCACIVENSEDHY